MDEVLRQDTPAHLLVGWGVPVGTISSWLARTRDRQLNLAPVIPVREACIIGKAIERAC